MTNNNKQNNFRISVSVYLMCFYIPQFAAIVEMFFALISLNDK